MLQPWPNYLCNMQVCAKRSALHYYLENHIYTRVFPWLCYDHSSSLLLRSIPFNIATWVHMCNMSLISCHYHLNALPQYVDTLPPQQPPKPCYRSFVHVQNHFEPFMLCASYLIESSQLPHWKVLPRPCKDQTVFTFYEWALGKWPVLVQPKWSAYHW